MTDINDLSKKAFEKVLAKVKEEGEAMSNHPCGFFPGFRLGGRINVGDADVSEEILELGIVKTDYQLIFPENIAHCLVWGPRPEALAMCADSDSKRYGLLLDSANKKQWWIEGDLTKKKYRIVTYDQIPDHVRGAIEQELFEKTWAQIKAQVLMSAEDEGT